MPWAKSFLGFQPASTDTKVPAKRSFLLFTLQKACYTRSVCLSPRSCCILLFTLQRACYTRSVCLSPRSCSISWHSFLPWHNLNKLSSAHVPAKLLYLVVYLAEGLLHAYRVFVPAFVHSCKCCICCFSSSAGDKREGEGEMARVVPIVWRISFSRRRGRVARGKPQGFALPLTQGGWQGQRFSERP